MGMIKDPTSWRVGFELGLAGFSFPYSKPRKPTAYLYNGVRLPALPEWDRGVYPFAVIVNNFGYELWVCSEPSFYASTKNNMGTLVACNFGSCMLSDNAWNNVFFPTKNNLGVLNSVRFLAEGFVWANYDILDSAGGIYLAASEPVPVYE